MIWARLFPRSNSLRLPVALCAWGLLALGGESAVCAAHDCIEGDGVLSRLARKTAPFTTLAVNGAFNLIVTCGQPEEVSLSGDANILPHVLTTVNNGRMEISAARSICSKLPVTIRISLPVLKKITVDGAGDSEVNKIDNDFFQAEVEGAVTVRLQGQTRKLTLTAGGSSTLLATGLQAAEVKATTIGSATAELHAGKSLSGECSEASTLKYSGTPKSVSLQAHDVCDLSAL